MSDNLKEVTAEDALIDAADKYAESYADDDRECIVTDVINAFYAGSAYTSCILASQQAAHDAEIARLESDLLIRMNDRESAKQRAGNLGLRLSTANERIAYLEGLVALQDEALKDIARGRTDTTKGAEAMRDFHHFNPEYVMQLQSELFAANGKILELEQRVKVLTGFVEDIAKNYDCDNDAHKYQTPCRACEAGKILSSIAPLPKESKE